MFVNFYNTGGGNTAVTLAFPEGGLPYPQPGGGIATTQALNEEGGGGGGAVTLAFPEGGLPYPQPGGGGISTRALNEEGGQTDHFSTQQALDLQQRADANKDGVLSKQELDAHTAAVREELRKIESGEIVFFADPTAQIQSMKQQLQVADFMKKNFDAMGKTDNQQGLSANDIRTTASQDGRSDILSQVDVNRLSQYPPQGGGQPLQQILQLMLQLMQLLLGQFGLGR